MADWTPSADISETDTAYLIKAEIPTVNKEDLALNRLNEIALCDRIDPY